MNSRSLVLATVIRPVSIFLRSSKSLYSDCLYLCSEQRARKKSQCQSVGLGAEIQGRAKKIFFTAPRPDNLSTASKNLVPNGYPIA